MLVFCRKPPTPQRVGTAICFNIVLSPLSWRCRRELVPCASVGAHMSAWMPSVGTGHPTESADFLSLLRAGVEKLPAWRFAWVLCCVGERSSRPLRCGGLEVICVGCSPQRRSQRCWAQYYWSYNVLYIHCIYNIQTSNTRRPSRVMITYCRSH